MRCRYSKRAKRMLNPRGPEREGTLLRITRDGFARVKWDGLSTPCTYSRDFIEVIKDADGEHTCEADAGRGR